MEELENPEKHYLYLSANKGMDKELNLSFQISIPKPLLGNALRKPGFVLYPEAS